ncbi:MAG: hypothetical protein JJW03_00415 [Desulfosarcina sp.]|nr:hypothetical protein [Desulfobacterales bacterium]
MILSPCFTNVSTYRYMLFIFIVIALSAIGNTSVFAKENSLSSIKYKMMVNEYYNRGTPIDHPEMPVNLRWMPYSGRGVDANKTEIIPTEGNTVPLSWNKKGSFSNDLFNGSHGDEIKSILSKHEINLDKLSNLLKKIGNESGVSVYDSGYMIIFDDFTKRSYIIKTSPMMAKDLEKIEFAAVPLQGTNQPVE